MRNVLTSMRFMLLWILGSVAALYTTIVTSLIIGFGSTLIATFIWTTGRREPGAIEMLIFSVIVYSLIGLAAGSIIGSIQKGLLRQKSGDSWRGWIIASVIGGVLAMNVTGFLIGRQIGALISTLTLPPKEVLLLIALQLLIIPPACLSLCQSAVLSQYVRGAWVWVLANVVAGVVLFSLAATAIGGGVLSALTIVGLVLLLSAAPGIVTGFAMLWLILFNRKHDYLEL